METSDGRTFYVPYTLSGDKKVTCDLENGLVCSNRAQTGKCLDYEIRFYCAADPTATYRKLDTATNKTCIPGWTPNLNLKNPVIEYLSSYENELLEDLQTQPDFCDQAVLHDGGWLSNMSESNINNNIAENLPTHSPRDRVVNSAIDMYSVTGLKCFYETGVTGSKVSTEIFPKHSDSAHQGYYPTYTCNLYNSKPISCQAKAECKPCQDMKVQFFCTCKDQPYTEITESGVVEVVTQPPTQAPSPTQPPVTLSPNSTGTLPPQPATSAQSPNAFDLYEDIQDTLIEKGVVTTVVPRPDPPKCTGSCKPVLAPVTVDTTLLKDQYYESSLAHLVFKNGTSTKQTLDLQCCGDEYCLEKERILNYSPCYFNRVFIGRTIIHSEIGQLNLTDTCRHPGQRVCFNHPCTLDDEAFECTRCEYCCWDADFCNLYEIEAPRQNLYYLDEIKSQRAKALETQSGSNLLISSKILMVFLTYTFWTYF